MKICFPTVGKNGLSEMVHNHFGSARYFTIYDTDSQTFQIVENDNQHHDHGACQPLGVISKHHVDAIVTNGMGRRAVQLLNAGGVKVYWYEGNGVGEAIEKIAAHELVELNFENACAGHGCHHE